MQNNMQKKALEISCYVAGAGAFGVFVRWLQVMLAFDDAGLSERSVFNLLVPAMVAAAAFVFKNLSDRLSEDRLYVAKEFCEALFNPGKLFAILRWLCGGIMCVGALLLMLESETDKNVDFLRVLAAVAFFAGLSFPLFLDEANYEDVEHPALLRIYSILPVLLFSVWLVVSYKQNSLNSVTWSYALEIGTLIAALLAFFRIAGFAFLVVNGRRCMFAVRLAAMLCIMSLADERYMGMQLMFLATAGMLLLVNWLLIINMKKKKPRPEVGDEGGFEKLYK